MATPSPYGYATGYVRTPPPKKKPVTKKRPVRAATPVGAVAEGLAARNVPFPNTAALVKQIQTMGPPQRTQADWDTLLNARVAPMEKSLTDWRNQALGQSEFQYERAQEANKALSAAFFEHITGGRVGAEAEAYAKEQFGNSHIPGQIAAMGVQTLNKLTADWNDRDWQLSGMYMEKMAEIPALREQMRANIVSEEASQYERNFAKATTMLDELWRAYGEKQKNVESTRAFGVEQQEQIRADRAQQIALSQLQLQTAQTAQEFAIAMTNQSGFVHKPNNKNPSQPIPTKVVAPGSTAITSLPEAESPTKKKQNRAKAVKAKEDAFAASRASVYDTVKGMRIIPSLGDLSLDQQSQVKYEGVPIEKFAKLTPYSTAFQQLWEQHGEDLMRYASQSGKKTLRVRINAMIDKALASVGIVPPTRRRGDLGKPGRG